MTKKFKTKIQLYVEKDISLFYNSEGNTDAYKLYVKHISAAPSFDLALLTNKHVHPFDTIFLVDFENETIEEVEDKIKIIPLKTY